MTKVTAEILNSTRNAIIDNRQETGKIIAIATYVDRQQVCFLKPEQKVGVWIPVSALVGVEAQFVHAKKSPSSETKNKLAKIPSQLSQFAIKKAEDDMRFLVSSANNILEGIKNKASSDIELISQTIQNTQKLGADTTTAIVKSSQEANEWLNQLTKSIGEVIQIVTDTINRYWNKYWLPRLVDVIKKLADAELERAKREVINLQNENPDYKPSQIAQELIAEKTIFATATGIVTDGLKIINPAIGTMIDLTKNVGLLAEMVYQIGIAYGFESMEDGEILCILGLAFTEEKLRQLGLDILLQQVPIQNIMISAATNIALFQLVGFTACQYYEAKANPENNPLTSEASYLVFEQQSDAYLEKSFNEKDNLDLDKLMQLINKLWNFLRNQN